MGKKRPAMGFLSLFFCLILLGTMAIPASAEAGFALDSLSAVLMDAETGQILYSKDCHKRMYPASITKIMTGMLALSSLDPEQTLTVSETAVEAVPQSSSNVYLVPEEEVSVEQMLYALALQSGNDAANVLAEAVSGTQEEFARLMTQTARDLGALETSFVNANGLPDPEHYTTAYDMALITAAALKVPGFSDYFSTTTYKCPKTNKNDSWDYVNKNQMLPGAPYYYEGILMSKTGWTSSALGTLVSAARRGDRTLIAVVMRSEILEAKYEDTWKLFDYGFMRFAKQTFTGDTVAKQLYLGHYLPEQGQSYDVLLPVGKDVEDIAFSMASKYALNGEDRVTVPVTASLDGTPLPDLELKLIRQVPELELAVEEAVEAFSQIHQRDSLPMILVAALALGLLGGALYLLDRHNKRRYQQRRLEIKLKNLRQELDDSTSQPPEESV